MEWLNYHHLLYFWTVAREGSVARACERLHLTQPTISSQLRALERSLGTDLFRRTGRSMVLTESGQLVFQYADSIFTLGREMVDTLKSRPTGRPMRLTVGIADVVPKMVAYRLLNPALVAVDPIQLICREGKPDRLLAELAVHGLDLVLSDHAVGPEVKVKAYNHLLGECGIVLLGTPDLAGRYAEGFPNSLDGAPFLLPTANTTLRRQLDHWFEVQNILPQIRGEFEDSALLKVFGQEGLGVFAMPSIIENEVRRQFGVEPVGRIDSIRERYYAISVQRQIKHPAVLAITQAARRDVFGSDS